MRDRQRKRELRGRLHFTVLIRRYVAHHCASLNSTYTAYLPPPPQPAATPTMTRPNNYILRVPYDVLKVIIQFVDVREFENFVIAFRELWVSLQSATPLIEVRDRK